jgi:hypothetical protein
MKIQSKYIQTHLGNMGELLYYRVTFPLPRDYALQNFIKEPWRQCIKGKWYYINISTDHQKLLDYVNKIQISVRKWKISQLQNEIKILKWEQ